MDFVIILLFVKRRVEYFDIFVIFKYNFKIGGHKQFNFVGEHFLIQISYHVVSHNIESIRGKGVTGCKKNKVMELSL